jgi:hypothetical protein
MQFILKIISVGLGLLLLESSLEHFYYAEWMTKHYSSVGLGFYGRFIIGGLQLIAGLGFIITQTRKITSIIFCIVMIVIIVKSLSEHSAKFPLQAVLLFMVSFILFILPKNQMLNFNTNPAKKKVL